MRKHQTGMSMVEIVAVMAIIGILSAIAIPAYRAYVIRGNRAEAKAVLLSTAGTLERCFTRFNEYDNGNCPVRMGVNFPTDNGNYIITPQALADTTFTLMATPQNGQVRDTDCAVFRYTQANQRTVSGTRPAQECWGR